MIASQNTIVKLVLYGSLYAITGALIASAFILSPHATSTFFRRLVAALMAMALLRYFIYMCLAPWYSVAQEVKERLGAKEIAAYQPRVSVIIPAWNEEVGLLSTVKTLLQSTYRNMEVVVINDGSTDNSNKVMHEFLSAYRPQQRKEPQAIPVYYRYYPNGGKGQALNRALKLATGEIIVSIDADCAVRPEAIRNFVKCFADPRVMAAVGNVKIGTTGSVLGVLQYLEFLLGFYFKKVDSLFNTVYIIGGAGGAFRREVFEQLGGYNANNITEDMELSVRIQKAGMKIVYAADALIYTEGASTVQGLKKQRLRWKRGRFETFIDHKTLFFSRQPHHNKLLSWYILPMALFGDVSLLSLEFPLLFLLLLIAVRTQDFSAFISVVLVSTFMLALQLLSDAFERRKGRYLLLIPIAWLLFYAAALVELYAVVTSLWGLWRGHDLRWQRWQRVGVFS
jgi:poly-beta-1,6-N-acetyl-D-glucosamine synthase